MVHDWALLLFGDKYANMRCVAVAKSAITGYCIQMSRAIIVGDGIVGLATAVALLNEGLSVEVIGGGDGMLAASWGNAGHIAVEQVEPLASIPNILTLPRRLFVAGGPAAFPPKAIGSWLPFGLKMIAASGVKKFSAGRQALTHLADGALPAWRGLMAAIGAPSVLREDGHHIVWENEEARKIGVESWSKRATGPAGFSELSAVDLAQIAALIGKPLAGGIHFHGTASISSHAKLQQYLVDAIQRSGGLITKNRVDRLGDLDADKIIVCAGFGSAKLIREHLNVPVPLIAERGYHIEGTCPSWPDGLPPVVFEDRSLIATRFETTLRIASFVEFADDKLAADPRKFESLLKQCSQLGIELNDVSTWMGARPTFPDYLPAMGRSNLDPRIYYAFGHQHLGLTLGPVSAKIMAALITGRTSAEELVPFNLDRFR